MDLVSEQVKTRKYDASGRRARAARTRRSVLLAARDLFAERGFAPTPVGAVARRAGVSVDTVYTAVGRKPQLLLAVIDMALAGGDEPVAADERDYVRAIRAAATGEEKIALYASALGEVLPRTAALLLALETAAPTDPGCAEVQQQLDERRHANMLRFAADLRGTGRLRADLDDQAVADVVWATSSVACYRMLERRGWTPERFSAMLRETWTRTLLA